MLIVFGWIPLIIGAMILQELSISIAPVVSLFGALPVAWFLDLALVGTGEVAGSETGDESSLEDMFLELTTDETYAMEDSEDK